MAWRAMAWAVVAAGAVACGKRQAAQDGGVDRGADAGEPPLPSLAAHLPAPPDAAKLRAAAEAERAVCLARFQAAARGVARVGAAPAEELVARFALLEREAACIREAGGQVPGPLRAAISRVEGLEEAVRALDAANPLPEELKRPEYTAPKYDGVEAVQGSFQGGYEDGGQVFKSFRGTYYVLKNIPGQRAGPWQLLVEKTGETLTLAIGREGREAFVAREVPLETYQDDQAAYARRVASAKAAHEEALGRYRGAVVAYREALKVHRARAAEQLPERQRLAAEREAAVRALAGGLGAAGPEVDAAGRAAAEALASPHLLLPGLSGLEAQLPFRLGERWTDVVRRLDAAGIPCEVKDQLDRAARSCTFAGLSVGPEPVESVWLEAAGGSRVSEIVFRFHAPQECLPVLQHLGSGLPAAWVQEYGDEGRVYRVDATVPGDRTLRASCDPGAFLFVQLMDAWSVLPWKAAGTPLGAAVQQVLHVARAGSRQEGTRKVTLPALEEFLKAVGEVAGPQLPALTARSRESFQDYLAAVSRTEYLASQLAEAVKPER